MGHLRVMAFLGGVALLFCVLVVFGVLAAGLWLAAPRQMAIGEPPPELRAQAVEIATPGGAVHGWLASGRPGGGGVVLMHGLHGSRLSMVRRAVELSRRGFSVLLFDFQGHGESPGRWITFGQRESADAAAAVAFLRRRFPGERLGVIGASLGGAAALLGKGPLAVDAMVLEAVYPTIQEALANRLKVFVGSVGPSLVPLFERIIPPIIGVRVGDLRPEARIRDAGCPKLIIGGTADDRTPPEETRRLFDAAPEPKQLWLVAGARHVDLESYDPAAYWQHVLPFLARALAEEETIPGH